MTHWPTDVDSGGHIKASAKVRVAALFPSRILSWFFRIYWTCNLMWIFGGISCNLHLHVGSLCCFDGGVIPRWFALILLWTVDVQTSITWLHQASSFPRFGEELSALLLFQATWSEVVSAMRRHEISFGKVRCCQWGFSESASCQGQRQDMMSNLQQIPFCLFVYLSIHPSRISNDTDT